MSNSDYPKKTLFEKEHSQFTLPKIKSIEHVELSGNPPGFIHKKKVDGRDLFFLGEDHKDYKKLTGHYYRMNKMVIPEYARMVNPDQLRATLSAADIDTDTPIDVSGDGFFYEGKLTSSVLLDVVGMVMPFTFRNMHFHFCDNHDPLKKEKLANSTATSGPDQPFEQAFAFEGGQCPIGVTSFSFNDEGRLQRKFVAFYITKEDMDKSWEEFNIEDPKVDIDPAKKFLKLYFTDNHYNIKSTSKDNNPKIDWDTVDIKGVFLIPGALPGDKVIYQCLLNIAGKSNTNTPIRATLKKWMERMDQLNAPEGEDMVLEIGGYDFVNMWMEPWSVYIGKNFDPVVLPASEIYKDGVLKDKLPS